MPLKIGFAGLLFMLRQRLRGQRVHKRAQGNVRDRESRGGSDRTEAENRGSHKTLFGELTQRRRAKRSFRLTDERVEEIKALRESGEPVPSIIKRTGFSKASIYRAPGRRELWK